MRKILNLVIVGVLMSFFFISCSKSETKATTIVGFWTGTYQVTGSPESYYLSFDLRPDGVMFYKGTGADGNAYFGEGTYSLTGENFSYSFTTMNGGQTGAVQNSTGTYSASKNTITGSWENVGATINGTYTVTKTE